MEKSLQERLYIDDESSTNYNIVIFYDVMRDGSTAIIKRCDSIAEADKWLNVEPDYRIISYDEEYQYNHRGPSENRVFLIRIKVF